MLILTSRQRSKSFAVFIAAAFLLTALAPAPTFAAALTADTLRNDLAYYRRVVAEKKLDGNGRQYLLQRIQDKYRSSTVNLSPLAAEFSRLRAPAAAAPAPRTAATVRLMQVQVLDNTADTRIVATAPGVRKSNYFLLKDPEPGAPLKLVLDLYGALEALPVAERNLVTEAGPVARVRTGQFKEQPDPIVRIVAELKENRPYRVLKEGDQWLVIIDKDPGSAATPPTAALPAHTAAAPAQPPAATAPAAAGDDAASTTDTGAGYVLETGDVLGIVVFPADELSRETIVQTDGTIPFPLIGKTRARGRTTRQLEDDLSRNLGKYIAKPQVTVTVKQFSKRQLFITGEVKSVGTFAYKNNYRLMDFISSLGGFTENANRREIKVYRGAGAKRQTYTVDLEEVIRSGNFAKDFALQAGDIIEVPEGRSRVAVLGDVRSPGYYDYRDNLRLMELVSLAGGFTDTADLKKVRILRPDGKNGHAAQEANLKNILSGKAPDVAIENGDTVYIPKGGMANANWFVSNILPWVSLISLVLLIRNAS